MEKIRINKYLSDCGYCSRRKADDLIECGHVRINGHRASMGEKVSSEDLIEVKGKKIGHVEEQVLIALNKPAGVVCTTSKNEKDNIISFVNYPARIYPIGRLDKYSEGLILLTNRGDLVNKMMRSRNGHEKEYVVTVDKAISPYFLQKMSSGVKILDTVTKPCKAWQTGKKEFRIILTQGLNRQIRRMCESLDYKVTSITRVRIMNIHLGDLPSGETRRITKKELKELETLLENSEE